MNNGFGFFTILGIIFIVLKLTNVIFWPWFLVLLPLYGGFVLMLLLLMILVVIGKLTKKNK